LSRKKVQKFQPGSVRIASIVLLSSSRWTTRASKAERMPSLSLVVRSVHRAGSSGAGKVGRDSWTQLCRQKEPRRRLSISGGLVRLSTCAAALDVPVALAKVKVAPHLVDDAAADAKEATGAAASTPGEICFDDMDEQPLLALTVDDERVPGLELGAGRRLVRLVVLAGREETPGKQVSTCSERTQTPEGRTSQTTK
jgi:hypothetical protein